jgi:hypothetical protein
LFTAVLITVIATATMRFHRSQAYELRLGRDRETAKRYANAAIDIALLKMRRYSNWRTLYSASNWGTDLPIEGGTYSINVTDPVDGDLQNRNFDPVRIQAIGKSGAAIYRQSVTASITPASGSCLDVAVIANDSISVSNSTVSTDQIMASNGNISSSSSQINTKSEAVANASGYYYNQSTSNGVDPRKMPISTDVLSTYLGAAEWISASSLPLFTRTEMISNTGFESNTNGWSSTSSPNICTINRTSSNPRAGSRCLEVKNRSTASSVAVYSVTSGDSGLQRLVSGHLYSLTIPIRVNSSCYIKLGCSITSAQTPVQDYGLTDNWIVAYSNTSESSDYNLPNITFRPTFAGAPTKMDIYIVFQSSKTDYAIDEATLKDITYPDNVRVFDCAVLTPTLNPYGSSSGRGIYRIECAGQNVGFGYGRIVGTVILNNPGILSGIFGPMDWKSQTKSLPALISSDSLIISMTDQALNELQIDVNLNPTGAPLPYYQGASDNDKLDSYSSLVEGLVYAANDIYVIGNMRANGIVIAGDDIIIQSGNVLLNYDRSIAEDPPAGFDVGLIDINIQPSSWTKIVQ